MKLFSKILQRYTAISGDAEDDDDIDGVKVDGWWWIMDHSN